MLDHQLRKIDEEPTVMWRMRRARGLSAHAVLGVNGRAAWVMWFVNDRPIGVRDFDDWHGAVRWSEQMKAQNWAIGWRLASDVDDAPPPEQPLS